MTPGELRELWISRIKDYQASREGVAAWCERHQVSPHQLWYWRRKVLRANQPPPPASKPQWVPLRLNETAPDGAAPILVRVGAAAIEVRSGFEPALFADVVRTLKTLC